VGAQPWTVKAKPVTYEALDAAARGPLLHLEDFRARVMIASIETFEVRVEDSRRHFVVVRSTDGATGVSVVNGWVGFLLPLLQEAIAPYFIGKDGWDFSGGVGYAQLLQFCSFTPNLALFQEYRLLEATPAPQAKSQTYDEFKPATVSLDGSPRWPGRAHAATDLAG
jgi:hypothetical protein